MHYLNPRAWFLLLLMTPLVGCIGDDTFQRPYRAPKLIKKQIEEDLTIEKPAITYVYDATHKRDPFRPPFLSATDKTQANPAGKQADPDKATEEKKAPQTALEGYELDQLKVVALITGVANPMALVEDPKKRGHIVRRGTRIGRNRGRVSRIQSTGLVISEIYRGVDGRRIVKYTTLRMKKKKQKQSRGYLILRGKKMYVDDNGQMRYKPINRESRDEDL